MPDFNKGKIYLLKSKNTDKCYVGSTCADLNRRFAQHKFDFKNKNLSSKNIFDYGDVYIELYKLYPCNNAKELSREEQLVMNELNCVNKRNSGLTNEEKKIKRKVYLERTKEHHKKVRKEYLERTKEHNKKVRKAYLEKTKEHTDMVGKKYYEKNKDYILKKGKEWRDKQIQVVCECSGTYTCGRQKRHEQSKKHQKWLEHKS